MALKRPFLPLFSSRSAQSPLDDGSMRSQQRPCLIGPSWVQSRGRRGSHRHYSETVPPGPRQDRRFSDPCGSMSCPDERPVSTSRVSTCPFSTTSTAAAQSRPAATLAVAKVPSRNFGLPTIRARGQSASANRRSYRQSRPYRGDIIAVQSSDLHAFAGFDFGDDIFRDLDSNLELAVADDTELRLGAG